MDNIKAQLEFLKNKLLTSNKRNIIKQLTVHTQSKFFDLYNLGETNSYGANINDIQEKLINKGNEILLLHANEQDNDVTVNSVKLKKLYDEYRKLIKIKGKGDLYIGYIFLEGYLRTAKRDEYIRAPLFLIPCNLLKNKEGGIKWVLERSDNEEGIINYNLIKYLNNYMDLNIKEDILEITSFPKEKVTRWIFKILKELNISISKINNIKIQDVEDLGSINITSFQDYKADEVPNIEEFEERNKFNILGNCVLGIYSKSSSALLNDYTNLIDILKSEEGLGLAGSLLNFLYENKEEVECICVDKILEDEKYFVTKLDNSQEEAILQLEKNKAVIVQGPPGTGKSQLITSLISNSLAKRRKIIMICEKEVALKVIYNRLEECGLSKYAVLLDEVGNTQKKKKIYESIRNNMKRSPDNLVESSKISELRKKSEEINDKTNELNSIEATLHKKIKCGLTPYEMYSNISCNEKIESSIFLESLSNQLNIEDLKIIRKKLIKIGKCEDIFKENKLLEYRKSFKDFNSSYIRKIYTSTKQLIKEYDLLINNESYKKILELRNKNNYEIKSIIESIEIIKDNLNKENSGFLDKIKKFIWVKFKSKKFLNRINVLEIKDIDSLKGKVKEYEDGIAKLENTFDELNKLNLFLKEEGIEKLRNKIYNGEPIRGNLNNIYDVISNNFDRIIEYDKTIESLNENENLILRELRKEESIESDRKGEIWYEILEKSIYEDWIDIAEREYPILKEISFKNYSQIAKDYRELVQDKEKLTPEAIKLILEKQFVNSEEKESGSLWRELGKKRGACSIRELVNKNIHKGLLNYKPVWLVTPDVAASVFPLEKGIFDIIIFDEASQLNIQEAVPLVYRSKKLVVAGDEKQLPPSKDNDDNEEEFDNIEVIEEIKQLKHYKSFLEFCNNIFSRYQKQLLWHYRSEYEELINFSNHAFYQGEIQIAPNVSRETKNKAIEWIKVEENAFIQDSKNEIEAQRVCAELHRILKDYRGKSIGIIAFTKKQQECIEKLIIKKCNEDIEFKNLYNEAENKEKKDERIFISNIDEIQGDERDIIMFSIGYAPRKDGRFDGTITGNLNKDEGKYRLNVAITRAKSKIVVVTSIEPSIFNEVSSLSKGAWMLQHYLEYCKAVYKNDKENIEQTLNVVNINKNRINEEDKFDSPFEKQVVYKLREKGYIVDTQIGCSGYRIDIAIVHPKDKNRYILGVEADGATYHSAKSAKERDIYRQKFLERRGWIIERIWSRDWWKNKDREIIRIEDRIKELMKSE